MDVILGTAGHIDHGKTTLVRALTGIDCDRLAEEQRRGITIELGFAWLPLPDGHRLGIVDVPGHERFVKNMVAGAAGMDFVILVIAADEGVMPQTREHLEICSLLGLRSGIVALTKTDLVNSELLELAIEDTKNALADTFLANAPIQPVSAASGAGLEELRAEIIRQAAALRERKRSDIFRVPIDRIFTMKGFGTVVTGTIISGACSRGEKLCVMPEGKFARARSLQVHNVQRDEANVGQRCAINLQGIEVGDINRGDVVARPDSLFPASGWFIRLHCLKSSPLPIRQRMETHFHHGSGEYPAKIVFHDRQSLEPGQSAIAEVKFKSPRMAIFGDHCVLRAHSPLRTIGGGIVIAPLPPVLKKRSPDYAHKIGLLQELGEGQGNFPAPKTAAQLVNTCLELCPVQGTDLAHLRVMTGLDLDSLNDTLQSLEQKGLLFCWNRANGEWMTSQALQSCLEKCRQRAEELHRREPLKHFFPPNDFESAPGPDLPQRFTQEILRQAVCRGILQQAGAGLKLASHEISPGDAESKLMKELLRRIKSGGRTPPFIREIIAEQGLNPKKIQPLLDHLCNTGRLVKIQDGVYFAKDEFEAIMATVRAWFKNHDELAINDVKTVLSLSRKYAIPVLEYLDSIRLTYRAGNTRRLCASQGIADPQ